MNYDEAKGPRAIAALRSIAVSDSIHATVLRLRDELLKSTSIRLLVITRWVRQQAEFNQVMRFVLAVPLVAGTATPIARDYRPPPAQQVAVLKQQGQAPEPTQTGPIGVGSPSAASAAMITTPVAPTVEPVPGPRVRANCSRGTRTVFLDDRPAVDASEDWKEGLTQRYQGAVCSFVPRFGVPEPGFRTYEAPAVETKPVEAASAATSTNPIRVRTTIEREAFDPTIDGSGSTPRSPDADGIEQALAVLGAPVAGRAVGGKVSDDRAKAAIAALAAADDQDLALPRPAPSKQPLANETVSTAPTSPRRIAVRWSENDLRHLPAYFGYRWTKDRVTTPSDPEMAMLEDELFFPAQATAAWSNVFGQESAGNVPRLSADVAERTRMQWLHNAGVMLPVSPAAWPTPGLQGQEHSLARQISATPMPASKSKNASAETRS